MASPGGLSLEGFVAAMLPPTVSDANSPESQLQPLLQRQGTTHFRRQSTTRAARSTNEPRRRSASTTDAKREEIGEHNRKKRKSRRRKSSGRGRRRGVSSRGAATRSLVNQAAWAEREGGGAGWSLSEEERIGVVTDLVELFQQVDHNGDQVRQRSLTGPAEVFSSRSFPPVQSRGKYPICKTQERLRGASMCCGCGFCFCKIQLGTACGSWGMRWRTRLVLSFCFR